MKRLYLTLVLLLLAGWPGQAAAQNAVTTQAVETHFRESLVFTLSATGDAEIVKADLLYKVPGNIAVSRNRAEFTPGLSIEAQFTLDQTQPDNYLPPGTEMEYWWEIVDAQGRKTSTDKQQLLYLDERYEWRTLKNDRLALYWYKGNDQFGQSLFDRANQALDTLETDFGAKVSNPIKLFIYAGHDDFMNAYYTSAQEWTGGAAMSDYGVVMMGITPSDLDWGLEATTHEISHLVLHQATDNPFSGSLTLPVWLDEGTAVYNSGEMKSRPDFKDALDPAIKNNQLLTLRTLSSPFSADPDEAILSYAQSGAVVQFIIDQYGREAMANLLKILTEGALYDEALSQALKVDTDGLDNAFRRSLNLPPLPEISPTVTPLPDTPSPSDAKTTPTPAAKATPGAAKPTAAPTTPAGSQPPAPAAVEPKRGLFNFPCCLGGMAPLLMMGLVFGFKRLA